MSLAECIKRLEKRYIIHKVDIKYTTFSFLNLFSGEYTINKHIVITSFNLQDDHEKMEIYIKKVIKCISTYYGKSVVAKLSNEVDDKTLNTLLNSGFEINEFTDRQIILKFL